MTEREELAKLEAEFIIGTKPLTDGQKAIYKHIDYIEREISIIDNRRKRLLRVWKALSKKLMGANERHASFRPGVADQMGGE